MTRVERYIDDMGAFGLSVDPAGDGASCEDGWRRYAVQHGGAHLMDMMVRDEPGRAMEVFWRFPGRDAVIVMGVAKLAAEAVRGRGA